MKETNKTETQVVCIYLCQMLGQPTIEEVQNTMKNKMDLKLNKIAIRNALNAGKKRGLLSVVHQQNDKTGEVEDAYSMKDVRFANPPEIAHIKNVLPKLLEDKGAKDIFDIMEGQHTEGEKKGGRLPDIRDYVRWNVTFVNILPVLGGQPFTNGDGIKATNKHRRIGDKIWIPGNLWVKSSIKNKLRYYNLNESKAMYMEVSDYFFKPKQKIGQEVCPSPPQRRGGQGTGLATYESILPGEEFVFEISFPTTSGIPEDIMRKILERGIRIGAKHKDYGLLKLKEINAE